MINENIQSGIALNDDDVSLLGGRASVAMFIMETALRVRSQGQGLQGVSSRVTRVPGGGLGL